MLYNMVLPRLNESILYLLSIEYIFIKFSLIEVKANKI